MIESIGRDGTNVIIQINTGLQVAKPILSFVWECQHEYVAELLKYQLWDQEFRYKAEIAKQPHLYLEPKEISALKSKLVKEWNGSKHWWK